MHIDVIEEGDATTRAKIQIVLQPGKDDAQRWDRHTGEPHFIEDEVSIELYPSDFMEHCAPDEITSEFTRRYTWQNPLKGGERDQVLEAVNGVCADKVDDLWLDLRRAVDLGDMDMVAKAMADYESPRWRSEDACKADYARAMAQTRNAFA